MGNESYCRSGCGSYTWKSATGGVEPGGESVLHREAGIQGPDFYFYFIFHGEKKILEMFTVKEGLPVVLNNKYNVCEELGSVG